MNIDEDDAVRYYDDNRFLHREDGPAVSYADGAIKHWYYHGELHRLDGPAMEYSWGDQYYYIHGIEYTEEEYKMITFFNRPGCDV